MSAGAARAIGLVFVYLVLGAVTLSPLLWTTILPLVDYPNHLARMSILLHAGDSSAVTANYVAHWRLLPNLAMDLVVPVMAHFIPLEVAGRLFVAATMAMLVIGTMALHRALHGRIGFWPLCALLFVYNDVLWWGFLNYLFGLGVALLAFSAWVVTARWPVLARHATFAMVACVLFLLHLFAFGVYGLLVASYEAGNWLTKRRWSRDSILAATSALAQFIPAGLLWLGSEGGPRFTEYGTVFARLYVFGAPVIFNNPPALLDASMLIVELAFFPVALYTGALKFSRAMRLPLTIIAIVAVLMPEMLYGSWAAQIRLPIAFVFVFVASTRLTVSRPCPVALLASAFLVLLGVRVLAVAQNWYDMNQRIAELRGAMQTLPEGIRLLTVQSPLPEDRYRQGWASRVLGRPSPTNYLHLPALAVIDRGAFVTSLFTGWYVVDASPRNAGMPRILDATLTPEQLVERARAPSPQAAPADLDVLGEPPCCVDWPRTFDFVLWVDFGQAPPNLFPILKPWASGSFFHIYRINRT